MISPPLFLKIAGQRAYPFKIGPTQSTLRMVPPMCLSLEDVDAVAEGLDQAFTALT